jgi:hypothetical protein
MFGWATVLRRIDPDTSVVQRPFVDPRSYAPNLCSSERLTVERHLRLHATIEPLDKKA